MRSAFGMIELIFAIVVIGIAMLAIPPLLMQTTSSVEEIVKQEAIFQGYRTMGVILTYKWDDKSVVGNDNNISHILDVTNGDSELNRTGSSSITRIGNFNNPRRVFFSSTTYASNTLGLESGESDKDDIDDFNGNTDSITATPGEFALTFDIHQKVFYIDDNANYGASVINLSLPVTKATASTNIKMVELNITENNQTIIILRSFSTNIGEPKPGLLTKKVP